MCTAGSPSQAVSRPARRVLQPRPVIRAEREVPDQLVPAQLLRPRPQPPDLRIGEEPRGQPDTTRPKRSTTGTSSPSSSASHHPGPTGKPDHPQATPRP
jgi:hypothetical protein